MRNFIYIISEYNPPHAGHAHLITELRKRIPDAVVTAIMSGNFVERGSPAIVDRFERAKAALSIGVDLVLSLPFPYSAASAEYFARAGVYIADSLSKAYPEDRHYLGFGSETGDIDELTLVSNRVSDPQFRERLYSLGYEYHSAKGIEKLYTEVYGESHPILSTPNNILAIEYIRAVNELSSSLLPVTVKRSGTAHDSQNIDGFPSASLIRERLYCGKYQNAFSLLPNGVKDIISDRIGQLGVPHENNYGDAILGALRRMKKEEISSYAECSGGVGEKLFASAKKATTYKEMLDLSATKQYTNARLRRASVYAYLGITKDDLSHPPHYTQLFAADKRGTEALHGFRRNAFLEILTKPADHKKMSAQASFEYEFESRADILYTLSYNPHLPADAFLRQSPKIIKD